MSSMSTGFVAEDFEKYRLYVEVRDDCTIQLVRDPVTGAETRQTWKRRRPLGQGGFGEVWQEGWKNKHGDWHYRAVKICSEKRMRAARIDYKRELSALAAFSKSECSGWFVNLHGWWMDSGNIFVAMEYLGHGDLSNYTTTEFQEAEIREITENVLWGLKSMHDSGFTHRDIKPQNILVVQKRPEFRRWWVKIADFGISKRILESGSALHTMVGTRSYCAPEILGHVQRYQGNSVYSSKVDMWSLGCVLFNISSRGHPAFSDSDLVRYCDGTVSFNPQKVSLCLGDSGKLFAKALLSVEPERRPTATEALRHHWLSSRDILPSQSKLQLIDQRNYNSFLDSAPLRDSLLDVKETSPNTHPVVALPIKEIPGSKDDLQATTSVVTRIRQAGSFLGRTFTSRAISGERIEGNTRQEPVPKPSSLETTMPGGWPDELTSTKLGPEATLTAHNSKKYPDRICTPISTLKGHTGSISSFAFSPNGELFATASQDRTARLWSVATGALKHTLLGHRGTINKVVFSPDGDLVATASDDGTARLWNPRNGTCRATLGDGQGSVYDVAFSPDGKLIATTRGEGELWTVATGMKWTTLAGLRTGSMCWSITFSPDGKLVGIVAISDNTGRVCDAVTGRKVLTLEGHTDGVNSLAFSPDGKLVATTSWDGTAKLWDTATGRIRATLDGQSARLWGIAFSPDGKLVGMGTEGGMAQLWDTVTGARRTMLEGHIARVNRIAFSPDGDLVATSSRDGTARLWDAATGARQAKLEGHTEGINLIAFSPDGKLLGTVSADKTAKLWRVDVLS